MPRTATTVVNIRNEGYDVYIGRAGRGEDGYFGNPYHGNHDRLTNIALYKKWFLSSIDDDPVFKARVMELAGKRLGCFCKPKACHGDVITHWLDHDVEVYT